MLAFSLKLSANQIRCLECIRIQQEQGYAATGMAGPFWQTMFGNGAPEYLLAHGLICQRRPSGLQWLDMDRRTVKTPRAVRASWWFQLTEAGRVVLEILEGEKECSSGDSN